MEINEYNLNAIVKGYLLQSCHECSYSDTQVEELLNGLRWSFDSLDVRQAYELGK